jgi:23S rRNA (adenine2503-C2)-methyltransferase
VTAKIQQFIDSNLGKLAISLHGTTDEQRSTLMPVNRKYPLEGLLEACRKLNLKRGHRLTFEYVLIEGLNDSPDDARRLAKILRGIPSKVNLLNYNENSFIGYKRPAEEKILHFQSILLEKGYTATYRRSRGRDIAAACGQLHHASKKREERMASRNVV